MDPFQTGSPQNRYQATFPSIFLIVLLAILGLSTISDSGLMWDEELHAAVPHFTKQMIFEGKPLPFDIQYYGPFVDLSSNVLFKVVSPFIDEEPVLDQDRLKVRAFIPASSIVVNKDFYLFKHIYVFFFALLAYGAASALSAQLVGWGYAALTPLFLALMPRFWGQSLFNPKDIPFAAAFTLAILVGVRLLDEISRGRYLRLALIFGLAAGVASSIRIGGGAILLFVFLAGTIVGYINFDLRNRAYLSAFFKSMLVAGVVWLLTVYLCHPAAWKAPIGWIVAALQHMSHHPFEIWLLFKGKYISNQNGLPLTYLPVWFFIGTPSLIFMLAVGGVLVATLRAKDKPRRYQLTFLLVLLQLLFLPLWAIAVGSSLDAEIRQFLFVLPAMAIFATVGFRWIVEKIGRWPRLRTCVVVSFAGYGVVVAHQMYLLHPFQYVYFNQFASKFYRGQPGELSKEFETDYLGVSLREATEWLNVNAVAGTPIYMNGPYHSVLPFLSQELTVKHLAHVKPENIRAPFYYISPPRGRWEQVYSQCPIVYRVERLLNGAVLPLSVIRHCPQKKKKR